MGAIRRTGYESGRSGGKIMIEKTYNVGIYCRLSNDDERDGESVSIENQENICQGGFHHKDEIPPLNKDL